MDPHGGRPSRSGVVTFVRLEHSTEIVDVHADEAVLDRGEVDWAKVRPLLFTFPQPTYWRLGEPAGRAWSMGKGYRKA